MLCFGLVVLCGLGLRLWGITDHPLALDEPFSVYHAQFSLRHIVDTLLEGNNPPLYELFLHGWIRLFGTDVLWVRLPSVLFSALAGGFWFLAVVRSVPLYISLGVAALFAFSTQYIYFSHEARSYGLLLLGLAVAAFFWTRLLWGEKRGNGFVLLAAFFTAITVYVHYLALIPVGLALIFGYFIATREKRGLWLRFVCGASLLMLPIVIFLLMRMMEPKTGGLWGVAPQWTQLYGFANIFLNGKWTLACLSGIVLLTVGLYLKSKKKPAIGNEGWAALLFLGLVFGCGYLAMYVVSYRAPIFIERYVQVMMPFFFVLLGVAFFWLLGKFKVGKWLWAVLLLVFCLQVNVSLGNERRPQVAAEMSRTFLQESPARAVLITPFWYNLTFAYYFDRAAFASPELGAPLAAQNTYAVWNGTETADWLDAHAAGTESILLLDAGESFVTGKQDVLDVLRTQYALTKTDSVDKAVRAYYFTRKKSAE